MSERWYPVENIAEVASPALLVYPERIAQNIERAISIVGDPQRLRPHVKTHKLAEIVSMHVHRGVTKFKCATIAEAELAAASGGSDVMLGYQPVGPNVQRLVALIHRFPETRFSTIADDPGAIEALSNELPVSGSRLDVFLDLDCGMHRTGVIPGNEALSIYGQIAADRKLRTGGLHAYDGHIHDSDLKKREQRAAEAFTPVAAFKQNLEMNGFLVPTIVTGGTPTFPFHARRDEGECSPGTYVFWDFGYADSMPDLPFEIAAVLLTRIVSKPGPNRLCLDLGHKSVASENPHPRVKFLNLPDAIAVTHSEEHLVIETPLAREFKVGEVLYGIPRHICPTVALHSHAIVIQDGLANERWRISARDRSLTI
jgi:D-threonine aldolase